MDLEPEGFDKSAKAYDRFVREAIAVVSGEPGYVTTGEIHTSVTTDCQSVNVKFR